MKLGEIKLQALMLIYPSLVLEYDGDDFEEIIFRLRGNHSYSSYIASMVGAINRAFTIIEQRGLSKIELLSLESDGKLLDLSQHKEILSVKEIYVNGSRADFELLSSDKIKIPSAKSKDKLEIVYYKRLTRISNITSNNLELMLGGIEECIPYFIKADLLSGEDMDSALASRETFYNMLKEFASKNSDTSFLTVYSLRGI